MIARRWIPVLLLPLTLATACQDADDQRTDSVDMEEARQARESLPPGLTAQLDSGSAAFRADDYETAMRHYRAVTEMDAELAAGWFGLYMVHRARGEADSATAALERARELAPRASILRAAEGDTLP
jgi:tetratricopeptide (TPR) repeat protein